MADLVEDDKDDLNLIDLQKAPIKWGKRRILAILAFIGFANVYAMRVNLSVGIIAMVNSSAIEPNNVTYVDTCPAQNDSSNNNLDVDGEFDWDENTQSLILGCFFWGYVVSNLFGGRLGELIGGKKIFGVGVLVTAILTLVTPIAAKSSVPLLIAVRVAMGFAEGVTFPAMNAIMAKWIPPSERSQTSSLVYAGSQFGTVISLPICGLLCQSNFLGGWPSVFYVFGAAGIAWFFLWMIIVSETPEAHPSISEHEKNYILFSLNRQANQKALPIPYKSIATSMPFYAILVVHFGQNWGFYTLLTELPTYLKHILHFNIAGSGFMAALPYLVMWLFSIMCGFLADYLRTSGKLSTVNTRRIFNSIGHYLPMICLFLIYFSKCNTVLTMTLLTLAVGFNGAKYSGYINSHLDIAPNFAGTLMGFTNSVATIPGFLAPTVVGLLINEHETLMRWQIVFWIACGVYFVGNTFYIIFVSGEIQPWNYASVDEVDNYDTSEQSRQPAARNLIDLLSQERQRTVPEVF